MSEPSRMSVRKLSSYSAAAALGAFAAPHTAKAEVIYTSLDPDVEVEFGVTPTVNIDNSGDGYFEVAFITTSNNRNMQIRGAYSGNVLTASGTYYVRGFTEGDLIGPGANSAGGANVAATGNNYNFFDGDDKYIGVAFEIAGQVHYGWIGFEIDSTDPLHGVIRDYAYESTPNTAIEAGEIPEPGSLGLLAAGAGALAFRRRRKCA